jgi:hypothetical protein
MNYDLLERGYIEDKGIDLENSNEPITSDEVLSSIANISIAYLDPCLKDKEELIGVWVLQTQSRFYAFDAYSGELVLERK